MPKIKTFGDRRKRFGNRFYNYEATFPKKRSAQALARALRKEGMPARIVDLKDGTGRWQVWGYRR